MKKKMIGLMLTIALLTLLTSYATFSLNSNLYDDPEKALQLAKDFIDDSRYEITTKSIGFGTTDAGSVKQWRSSSDMGKLTLYELSVQKEGLVTVQLDYQGDDVTKDMLAVSLRVKNSFMDGIEINAEVDKTLKIVKPDGKLSRVQSKYIFYAYPGTYYFEVKGWSSNNELIPYAINFYQDTFPELMQGTMGDVTQNDYPNQLGSINFNKEAITVESSLNMKNWRVLNSQGNPGYYKINTRDEFSFTSMFTGDAMIKLENKEATTITDYTEAYQQGVQTASAKNKVPEVTLHVQPDEDYNTQILEVSYGLIGSTIYPVEAGKTYKVTVSGNQLPANYRFEIDYPDTENTYNNGIQTASNWAVDEINKAVAAGLKTNAMTNENYGDFATRENFAEIIMTFYDKLDGPMINSSDNKFLDTNNPEIIRAKNAGIINGVNETTFSPNAHLTREQLCVMILRALEATNTSYITHNQFQKQYTDQEMISPWAKNSVRIINRYEIMNGSGDLLDPQGTVTKEMAMLMLYRAYKQFDN